MMNYNQIQTFNFQWVFFSVRSFNPFWKLRLGISAWDFLGVNVWSRDFFGFCWKPQGFFWVLIFAPIRSSPSLETRSTPPGAEHLETPMDYADTIHNSSLFPKLTWILKRYATWLRKTYGERRKDIFNQAYRFNDTMYFNFGIGERVDPMDGGRTKCQKNTQKRTVEHF